MLLLHRVGFCYFNYSFLPDLVYFKGKLSCENEMMWEKKINEQMFDGLT